MGTMISLKVGALEVDWGKNSGFSNHSPLFQHSNLTELVETDGHENPFRCEAYSRPLGETVCRLELLGYTLAAVKKEYINNLNEYGEKIRRPLSFHKFLNLIKSIDLLNFTGEWSENYESKYVPPDVIKKVNSEKYMFSGRRPDYWCLDILLETLSPYAKMRILAENKNNLDQPVIWAFGDLVESGWAAREEFMRRLGPEQQFLIVTEGSSDSKIIKKALSILRPEYADFFRFVDMEEGYPFTGTGNLHKFAQGLVSIGILNRVVILYDNDTEGLGKYQSTKQLSLPQNMVVAKLPDIAPLRKFPTIGPHGRRKLNINGKAAAIECYLDLNFPAANNSVCARWTSYVETMKQYQGSLENKTAFAKIFLELRYKEPKYDFSKIEAVLDHLYKICTKMVTLDAPAFIIN